MTPQTPFTERGDPVDFQKALDKAPHPRLPRKLSRGGRRGEVLSWVEFQEAESRNPQTVLQREKAESPKDRDWDRGLF